MGDLIKFDGRIGRGTYWKYTAILFVGYMIASFFWFSSLNEYTGEPSGGSMFIAVIIWLAMLPISFSAGIRRWHDHDKSGWWMLISLVPLIGPIYAFVMCGFVAGTPGSNTYGAPEGHYATHQVAS